MKSILTSALLLSFLFFVNTSHAQLVPMGVSYFQNPYLNNPALAGRDEGFTASMNFRKQWSNIPGGPVNQAVTAEYGFGNKVGAGLNILNDKSGIFRTTRVVATYSYFIPFGNNQRIHFGISAGFQNQRISNEDVNGDINDVELAAFNKRQTYIDGDFGVAYTSQSLSAQVALPQLKDLFNKDYSSNVNAPKFFSSVGYKIRNFSQNPDLELEPMICYRGIKGSKDIFDLGTNLSMIDGALNLFGMYHTSESTTFGIGITYHSLMITGAYSSATSQTSSYTNGDFEIGLKINLQK
jgi:type IX secretion system PorP/SprF family membrane protein